MIATKELTEQEKKIILANLATFRGRQFYAACDCTFPGITKTKAFKQFIKSL